jgi:hypothetical protein
LNTKITKDTKLTKAGQRAEQGMPLGGLRVLGDLRVEPLLDGSAQPVNAACPARDLWQAERDLAPMLDTIPTLRVA